MSDFKDKCGDVLTGEATGTVTGGSIGEIGEPITFDLRAITGEPIGSIPTRNIICQILKTNVEIY